MNRMPDGRYAVDSFREEGVSYVVSIEEGSCSCPQYVKTGRECKHLIWVRMELKALEQARKEPALTQEELKALFA